MNKGQGLIEYLVIIGMVVIVVVVILLLLGPSIGNIISNISSGKTPDCYGVTDSTFRCKDYQIQQCIKSEKYTENQCIAIVGGK
jgi:pilus assembly protein Flp/PilA